MGNDKTQKRCSRSDFHEGAVCWRTTIKSVIKGGAQHCGVVASLLNYENSNARDIERWRKKMR